MGSPSKTITIKPTQAGVCHVTVKGVYSSYSDTRDINYSKTVTVTVKAPGSSSSSNAASTTTPTAPKEDTRSKENALSSLTVNEGSLSPKFSANTTKYSVNLDGDKTKITIDAKAKDSKAKVSGTGEKDLKVGKNTFVVKCVAENGSTRNYTIEVNVDEKPVVFSDYKDQKLGVVRNLEGVDAPSGFEKSTTTLSKQKVDAWTNEKMKLTVCYLTDENNKKAFYVVEEGKIQYEFKTAEIDGRHFIIVPIENKLQQRDGFQYQKVKVRELELDGWIYNDKAMKNYVQVYLMNDNGEKNIYDYEITENQLQLYTEPTQEEKGIDIFMITTFVFAVTTFACAFLYFNFKKKSISQIQAYYNEKKSQ
ncbi:MAG: cadherin-like beta sandwich domain-containing protein [Longibaculum sp.]